MNCLGKVEFLAEHMKWITDIRDGDFEEEKSNLTRIIS